MGLDLNQQQQKIESSIKALKDYNETSNAEKQILKKGGGSFSKVANNLSSQLNKISEQQKENANKSNLSPEVVIT
jgi:predicted RNA-binding protein with RPS1 domain